MTRLERSDRRLVLHSLRGSPALGIGLAAAIAAFVVVLLSISPMSWPLYVVWSLGVVGLLAAGSAVYLWSDPTTATVTTFDPGLGQVSVETRRLRAAPSVETFTFAEIAELRFLAMPDKTAWEQTLSLIVGKGRYVVIAQKRTSVGDGALPEMAEEIRAATGLAGGDSSGLGSLAKAAAALVMPQG